MNALPEHRRALYGRTWSSPWSAASMDPIQRYERSQRFDAVAGVALAVSIGIGIAALLAAWWGGA